MDALKIYKSFENIEKHWHCDNTELWVMPSFRELEECLSILPDSAFDDEGINAHIKSGYVCFDLVPICEYFGLNAEDIFPPKEVE